MSIGKWLLGIVVFIAILATAIATTRRRSMPADSAADGANPVRHHEHEHAHNDSTNWLALSDAAKASLGLETSPVVLQEYWRSLPVPAEVMEEPGHCEQGVSTPVHGIVLKIHAFHGQTVQAGDPLFDVRPTSELLASAQTALLKSVQEIEIVQSELKRLGPLGEAGGIPSARVIEKENELKRLDAARLLQMQELLVRGLSIDQIEAVIRSKKLIQLITIHAPTGMVSKNSSNHGARDGNSAESHDHDSIDADSVSKISRHEHGSVYSIEQLNVHLGKLIQPGEELCRLARHSELLIAARAFERESLLVTRAIEKNWPVKAVFEVTDESPLIRDGLTILYSDNVVEPDSRTVRFYIPLANELVRDQPAANGLAYRSWRFKPGQRLQVLLPTEHLVNQIVLPAEAVVKEGAEAFVFRVNGKRLQRIPVRLWLLDSRDAVIKPDGTIAAGDIVVRNQAYQLELALKNSKGPRTSDKDTHDHAGHGNDHHHEH